MSVFSVAFYFVFAGNLLTNWGLLPGTDDAGDKGKPWIALMLCVGLAVPAALADYIVFRTLLMPMGLESLGPISFTLILFLLYYLATLISRALRGRSRSILSEAGHTLPLSLALYAAALASTAAVNSLFLVIASAASAALGFAASSIFLKDILDRMALEKLPENLRGQPVRFMSAALMALAFSGIDAAFFSRLVI
jgi:Na+-translocating ferredoxin:NAD+ oxidoreductase subunit A